MIQQTDRTTTAPTPATSSNANTVQPSDDTPIKIAILAMGGEGGGVLADWVVSTAEHAGYYAQNTSVPGVAQRTGATIYYVEILPRRRADTPAPVLSLMPVPGDVDVVLASELMESARAVQRGLVTNDKTTLITSSNRVYALPEKMAMGDGRKNSDELLLTGKNAAKRYICHDFSQLAQANGSIISATLFGALAASGTLPLERADFEATIQRSGVGVAASLKAFDAAFERCKNDLDGAIAEQLENAQANPANRAQSPRAKPLDASTPLDPRLDRLAQRVRQEFPENAHGVLLAGISRAADYQDQRYAAHYLDLLQPLSSANQPLDSDESVLESTARHLALWMTYEDTIRVAEVKIRSSRQDRVQNEQKVKDNQLLQLNEYFHPRLEEITDILPVKLAQALLAPGLLRRLIEKTTTRGRIVRSNRLGGFLLLYVIAAMRSWRRRSLRYQREHTEITRWLEAIQRYAAHNPAFALEIARCQNLVKGYGDTHARGLSSYQTLVDSLPELAGQSNAAPQLATLRQAALADDRGATLQQALEKMGLTLATNPQAGL